jgi:hypothetical protein
MAAPIACSFSRLDAQLGQLGQLSMLSFVTLALRLKRISLTSFLHVLLSLRW